MTKEHIFGITKWVQSIRNDRVLAVLSGFSPNITPCVGTFYILYMQTVRVSYGKKAKSTL